VIQVQQTTAILRRRVIRTSDYWDRVRQLEPRWMCGPYLEQPGDSPRPSLPPQVTIFTSHLPHDLSPHSPSLLGSCMTRLELRSCLCLHDRHRSCFAFAQANIQELLLELDNHRHPSQDQPILRVLTTSPSPLLHSDGRSSFRSPSKRNDRP
jgi:hypothetical protein